MAFLLLGYANQKSQLITATYPPHIYFRRVHASTYPRATKNFQLAIKRSSLLPTIAAAFPPLHRKHPEEGGEIQRPTSFPNRSFIYLLIVPPISPSTRRSPPHLYAIYVIELEPSNTDRADPAE